MPSKETGTPVDFTSARAIDLQRYTFRDDIIGIYAYQSAPVTVDVPIRDGFLNGNLQDLLVQASGQGMDIQYVRITWNETAYGNKYYITDLAVGVVAKIARDFNTGPAYLIDALKAVSWYNQLASKVTLPWNSWLLLQPPAQNESFKRWNWEAISAAWWETAPIDQPIPDPPLVEEVNSHFLSDGKVSEALGTFIQEIVDQGYTCAILRYKTQVCYERSPEIIHPPGYYHGYEYKTHTRLSVDFQTTAESLLPVFPPLVIAAIGLAIALIIGSVGIYYALRNLTTQEKSYEKWSWVYNPNTGQWEWMPVETGTEKGAPEWWGTVLTAVGVVSVVILAAVILPRVLPARKERA